MSHLQESVRRMTENDPSIEKIRRIPTATMVVYHGRVGAMRQGRTEFPALVLKQHPDDGSLDMIVFFEAEDMIWEQRVQPYSDAQPGHCWSPVEPVEVGGFLALRKDIGDVEVLVRALRLQMYGDYEPPEQSMIEYLDGFDKRLQKLEKSMRK